VTKIQIILGSTRPQRFGVKVAQWVYELAEQRPDLDVELIDLKEINLPLLDEPLPAITGKYEHQHTKDWSRKVAPADGYIFVTAEHNASIPASLKNAIDFLQQEWSNKAVGFVSYGAEKGVRAVAQLRQVVGHLNMADVQATVGISLFQDVNEDRTFKPHQQLEQRANLLFDQLTAWANAMKLVREQLTEISK
jgi:NAD(P)H-dependent FMN reductase